MSCSRSFALFLAVFGTMAGIAAAGQKPTSSINVTTIVHDYDTSNNWLLMRSDDFNGVGQATYSAALDPNVSSIIASGGWQVYLGNQTVRTVYLTLSNPVPGSNPSPAPNGYYSANTEIYSTCFDQNNNVISFLAIAPFTSLNRCQLGVDFSYGRTKYKLVMSPTRPGTGWATVTCNAGNSSGVCDSWTIVPNTTAGSGNVPEVANLYQFSTAGSLVYIGSYYNTYRIDITNP